MRLRPFALVFLLAVFCAAQRIPSPPPPLPDTSQPPDRGAVAGNTYTSHYFDFSYDFPAGWEFDRELAHRTAGDPPGVAPAPRTNYDLFRATRAPAEGMPTDAERPSIQLSAELLKAADAQKSPEQYLADYVPKITGSQVGQPRMLSVAGHTFLRQDFRMALPNGADGAVYTSVLLTPLKGYVVGWIFSADSANGVDALVGTLNSLHFR